MPWKHAGRQDYNLEDSKIFMEWAKHSGRYREGIDKPEVNSKIFHFFQNLNFSNF